MRFFLILITTYIFMLHILTFANATDPKHVDIWSDGTRMSGDIHYPIDFNKNNPRPAIIMSHGWGGKRSDLNKYYVPKFVNAGFIVLTFDYRGWEDSDSRLVLIVKQPALNNDGIINIQAKAIREVVDPIDQTRDIFSALDYISGEPGVDTSRIGIWGTSMSGGYVICVAAQDKRVAAVYSQVSYQGIGLIDRSNLLRKRAIQKARGKINPIPENIDLIPNLKGSPDLAKMLSYMPIDWANKILVPTLIVDVDSDELFDRKKNGKAVYDIIKQNAEAKYKVFPGTHYDIYYKHFEASNKLALDWFIKHLKLKKKDKGIETQEVLDKEIKDKEKNQ